MAITTTAGRGFDKIFIDLVGPLPRSNQGQRYILTIQDELTKFSEAVALPNKEADTVARALVEEYFLRYGLCSEVSTDKGTEFINELFREVCKLLQVTHLNSTACHHESLGALENSHKGLGAYLRCYSNQKPEDWDQWLRFFIFVYNTSVHLATGYTPNELVYGKLCNFSRKKKRMLIKT